MELSELREKIDQVDKELLKLFLRRMEIAAQIAAEKKQRGIGVMNRSREEEILTWVSQSSGQMQEYALPFYQKVLEVSREYQKELMGARR